MPIVSDVIYDIINKHCSGVDFDCKDFVLPCNPSPNFSSKKVKIAEPNDNKSMPKLTKEKTTKSSSKKNDTVKTKSYNVVVSVPAEVLFTDPNSAIYKEETENDTVKNVYILLSVDKLLSRAQKLLLDPLVIKIKKLSNLPTNILKELGYVHILKYLRFYRRTIFRITSIYTAYNIPYIANYKSIEKPVLSNIKFNDAHIFFNDSVSKLKLIEFIQSRRLHIEVSAFIYLNIDK